MESRGKLRRYLVAGAASAALAAGVYSIYQTDAFAKRFFISEGPVCEQPFGRKLATRFNKKVIEEKLHAVQEAEDRKNPLALKTMLHDNEPEVRLKALESLEKIGSHLSDNELKMLLRDNNPLVRKKTIETIEHEEWRWTLDTMDAVTESFLERMDDCSPEVRIAAIRTAHLFYDSRITERLVGEVSDPISAVRKEAAAAANDQFWIGFGMPSADMAAKAVEALILAAEEKDPEMRERAITSAGSIFVRYFINSKEWEPVGDLIQSRLLDLALDDNENLAIHSFEVFKIMVAMECPFGEEKQIRLLKAAELTHSDNLRDAMFDLLCDYSTGGLAAALMERAGNPRMGFFVRRGSAKALACIGHEKAFEVLGRMLSERDPNIQDAAVEALGFLGGRDAEGLLVSKLTDNMPNVRLAAIKALGKGYSTVAAATVIGAFSDKNRSIKLSAIGSFTSIRNRIESEGEKMPKAVEDEATQELIKIDTTGDSELDKTVLTAVSEMGNRHSVPYLIEKTKDKDREIREMALKALGKAKDKRAIAPLKKSVGDSEPIVVWAALAALGEIGDISAADVLLAKAREGGSFSYDAIVALGKIGYPNIFPIIEPLLGPPIILEPFLEPSCDSDAAAYAAGMIKERRAIPKLMGMLRELRIYTVSTTVPFALGEMGVIEALPVIEEKYYGHYNGIFWGVEDSLTYCGGQNWIETRMGVIRRDAPFLAMKKLAGEHLGDLFIAKLRNRNRGFMAMALKGLVRSGDRRAKEYVMKSLTDKDLDLRKAAISMAGEMKEKTAVPALIGFLGEKEVAETAVKALGRIGDARALPTLRERRANDPSLREEAIKAIAKIEWEEGRH